jgi:hypothetical protein
VLRYDNYKVSPKNELGQNAQIGKHSSSDIYRHLVQENNWVLRLENAFARES